jgi:hypothetical protein
MSGVETQGSSLELKVCEEVLRPEADEGLREVESPPLPALAEPRMPSALPRDSNGPGADRNPQGLVPREVSGRIEADDESVGGVDPEEELGEKTEWIPKAGSGLERVRKANRRGEAGSPGAGGAQAEQEAADAVRPPQGVLERESETAWVRSLDPKKPATGAGERAAEVVQERRGLRGGPTRSDSRHPPEGIELEGRRELPPLLRGRPGDAGASRNPFGWRPGRPLE